jgi:hypothetical protein
MDDDQDESQPDMDGQDEYQRGPTPLTRVASTLLPLLSCLSGILAVILTSGVKILLVGVAVVAVSAVAVTAFVAAISYPFAHMYVGLIYSFFRNSLRSHTDRNPPE